MHLLRITVEVIAVVVAIVSIVDLVRHPKRSGWAMAGWIVLIVVLPLIGSIIYWSTRKLSPEEVAQVQESQAELARERHTHGADRSPTNW
jgi:NADH:ubiquinone oxidoreductase subunit 6 (subunit J)